MRAPDAMLEQVVARHTEGPKQVPRIAARDSDNEPNASCLCCDGGSSKVQDSGASITICAHQLSPHTDPHIIA